MTALVIAQEAAGTEVHSFGWFVGLGIAFLIILVVVVLVASILNSASQINKQAKEAILGLDEARRQTLPMWDVQKVNTTSKQLLDDAVTLREAVLQ